MSRCIAVVGGSGFVGTRLCSLLDDTGRPFVIIDKRLSETFPDRCLIADVRDLEQLIEVLPEGADVLNLAAEHRDDVSPRRLYDDVNVGGATNLCIAAKARSVSRIVFTSSVACYGNAPPGTNEGGVVAPFNDYGRTKFLAEEVFRGWQREDPSRRTVAIVRPTVIFGERNRGNVYNLIKQIASGRFVMVGAGRNTKSMAYVGNVAALLMDLLTQHRANLLLNYVDEPSMDMAHLVSFVRGELGLERDIPIRVPVWSGILLGYVADAVSKVSGRKLPVSSIRVRKFIADSHFTSSFAEIGFSPPYDLEEALRKTIKYEFLSDAASGPLFYSE